MDELACAACRSKCCCRLCYTASPAEAMIHPEHSCCYSMRVRKLDVNIWVWLTLPDASCPPVAHRLWVEGIGSLNSLSKALVETLICQPL